jgi:PAS domain S-box-containing protein
MDRPGLYLSSLTREGRYRLLVEAVTDYAIYLLDPSGIVTTWNPGAERFKGYTANEIIGKHFSRFYTEEDRGIGLPRRALETAAREGKFEAEGWRVRKDGSRFWAYVVIDPIRHPNGEIIGYAKITRDLTERKVAEHALHRSEEQFRLLVQGVSDYAIFLLDADGNVTNWNLGAQRIKGYLPNEIVGQHFSCFYADEERAAGVPERALETVRSEGRFEKEGWRVRKDGSRFWAHVVIDGIRDDHGRIIGYAKITRDITERKKAQDELERVRESSLQAQKMEAIGQLTGGVAHDFNNLLTAVLGSLELLRKRLSDPKSIALLENAIKGAQRGATLTKRMLAFARNYELKREAVAVPELIHGMREMLQRSIGPSFHIETRFPLALSPVAADAHQLELAILNLTLNARDAMPNGGDITLSAREENISVGNSAPARPGRYVCLSVIDSGEGMDENTMRRAIEPFFTTKEVGKGTGLGLSMVHGFAEQSGGRLSLHSQKGLGTTAELQLPVAHAEALEIVPETAPSPTKTFRPLTVLAVDDDALISMNVVAMLEDLGHTVFEAHSGDEALGILRREDSIDLVITDQAMPKMTGVELAEIIKREWPDIPVLLATGYVDRVAGDTDLPRLAKPYLQEDLAAAIVRVNPPIRKQVRIVSLRTRTSNSP